MSNGTAALFLSLVALGIKAGDRILTTPLTWIATAAAARAEVSGFMREVARENAENPRLWSQAAAACGRYKRNPLHTGEKGA